MKDMLVLRTGRRWLPVPLAAAGLVALAACGGGDSTAPTTDPTSTASADAFAECMTEQGVPAPQGGTRITGPGPGEPGQQQGAPVTRRNAPPAPDGVGVRRTVAPGS
jgi:hypothetical protein